MGAYTYEEAARYAACVSPALEVAFDMALSHLRKVPSLMVTDGETSKYDTNMDMVEIGAKGVYKMFHPKADADMYDALDYVMHHELGHILYSASTPYRNGMMLCWHEFVETIAANEGLHYRFFSDADYDKFINVALPAKTGKQYDAESAVECIEFVFNSLEDGRSERIQAQTNPKFKNQVRRYRGQLWMDFDYPDYEMVKYNPVRKLIVVLDVIQTLATTQLYPKGFGVRYAGNDIFRDVTALIPKIAEAINAPRMRGMAKAARDVVRGIFPYIVDAFDKTALSDEDKKELEAFYKAMLEAMATAPDAAGTSEDDEQDGESDYNSLFNRADLEVTLDDESYDKLMDKLGNRSSEDGHLTVKREHPLPPRRRPTPPPSSPKKKGGSEKGASESGGSAGTGQGDSTSSGGSKQQDGQDALPGQESLDLEKGQGASSKEEGDEAKKGGGASGADKQENTGDAEGTGGGTGEKADDEDGSDATAGGEAGEGANDADDSDTKAGGGAGEKEDDADGSDAKTGGESDGSDGQQEGTTLPEGDNTSPEGDAASSCSKAAATPSADNNEAIIESVMQQMQEAAKEAREAASEMEVVVTNTALHSAHTQVSIPPVVRQAAKQTVEPPDMSDICSDFVELKREYTVDSPLPPVTSAKAKALRRKIERYFQSRSTPTVKNRESGTLDVKRIANLAMGETDIFMKKGMDKVFSGCAYILVDNSGSMTGGNKREKACLAGALVEEGFKGIIPFKIVAFDEQGNIIHEIIKDWTEVQRKNCCWNFFRHGRHGGGNEDGFDIEIATRELLARPEKRKLLCIISDGAPGDREHVQRAVANARKKGIMVNAIYIDADISEHTVRMFEEMYLGKDCLTCSPVELDKHLVKVFEKFSKL